MCRLASAFSESCSRRAAVTSRCASSSCVNASIAPRAPQQIQFVPHHPVRGFGTHHLIEAWSGLRGVRHLQTETW